MKIKMKLKKNINDFAVNGVRRTWKINPVTRVVESKKKYKRTDKSWKKED